MVKYTIGFANIDEMNPFAVSVRESLEASIAQHPELVLLTRDNAMDSQRARANIQEFADYPVDLVIIYHIDERVGQQLAQPFRKSQTPIISLDIPIAMTTFFGIDAKQAAEEAAHAFCDWVDANWHGQLDKLLIMTEYRVLDVVKQRFDYALPIIQGRLDFNSENLLAIDNGGQREIAAERVTTVMNNWSAFSRIGIIALNDHIAIGALDAARNLDRESDVALISYDGTDWAIEEFSKPDSRLIVSPSFRPDLYGEGLTNLAIQMLNGEQVPQKNLVSPLCLTRESFAEYN